MWGKRAILAIAMCAAVLAGGAAPAQAQDDVIKDPLCQAAYVDGRYVGHYCVIIDFGVCGTVTVCGTVIVGGCAVDPALCTAHTRVDLRETGFKPNLSPPLPRLAPGPAIVWPGGAIGTVYNNGSGTTVYTRGTCVGLPPGCP